MSTIAATPARTTARDGLLRLSLRADAVLTGTAGVGIALAAWGLDSVIGLPAVALLLAGLAFAGYGVAVRAVSRPATISHRATWMVIGANVACTVAGVLLLIAGVLPLTTTGVVVTALMAVYTGVFAELQFMGLRRAR
ncbi:MAG TPA: hypothetical protein VGD67_05970 [Pseudonocardiaceae bacterium]